jgi:hypothetical protein
LLAQNKREASGLRAVHRRFRAPAVNMFPVRKHLIFDAPSGQKFQRQSCGGIEKVSGARSNFIS